MRNVSCLFIAVLVLCFLPTTTTNAQLFEPAVSYYSGDYPTGVVIGDLDGSGYPDLAVSARWSEEVWVLLNNGDGTFQTADTYEIGFGTQSVAIGDLNNDGNLDLALTAWSAGVLVLLGNGDGTFQAAEQYGVGEYPGSVAIGDLDGDGNPDLAVANSGDYYDSNDGDVSVLLGNGDGTFQEAVYYLVGELPQSVAIGDFDLDGNLDLAAANLWSNDVSVLLGNGDGTFQAALNFTVAWRPRSVAIGDLNEDGIPDLAVANEDSDSVSTLLGNGDGTFQDAVHHGVGLSPKSVALGDLNTDGHLDLATANYSGLEDVFVLLGNGDGSFYAGQAYEAGAKSNYVAIGDLDGSGYPDLAVTNQNSDNVSVLINTTGTLEATVSAELNCVPSEGILPFIGHFDVNLTNEYTGFARRIHARIVVVAAGGFTIQNLQNGTLDLDPGDSFQAGFNQILPAHPQVLGINNFTLIATDVTPAPYNQPPHPPSGYVDTDSCTVEGIAP